MAYGRSFDYGKSPPQLAGSVQLRTENLSGGVRERALQRRPTLATRAFRRLRPQKFVTTARMRGLLVSLFPKV